MNDFGTLRITLILALVLAMGSCTKTLTYTSSGTKIKPLKSESKSIILHEDLFFVNEPYRQNKKQLIDQIKRKLSAQSKFQFQFYSSGSILPKNDSNRMKLLMIGGLWVHRGNTAGSEKVKVTRYRNTPTMRKSWEEIEYRTWDQGVLQTVVSLVFIEISSDTEFLRSTLSASNDKRRTVRNGGRVLSDQQQSDFFVDESVESGVQIISTSTTVSQPNQAINDLLTKAVESHLDSL